jgi:nucleoside-diphosphate-sugar epimerase
MKILITGVCGFVGSALAECLLERVEVIRVAGMPQRNHGRISPTGKGVYAGPLVK